MVPTVCGGTAAVPGLRSCRLLSGGVVLFLLRRLLLLLSLAPLYPGAFAQPVQLLPPLLPLSPPLSPLSPRNPPWEASYRLRDSLITMQVNRTGLSSPTRGAQFGIVSYDWSNGKELWAKGHPMFCQELLLEQAVQTKAAGAPRVFVYRNIVKALPWFAQVREKLVDPAYAGWFLRFDSTNNSSGPSSRTSGHRGAAAAAASHVPPCAAENATKCSNLYHDQLQTPQVPTADHPHPDGSCPTPDNATDDDGGGCDCGPGLPCGEYLFDHRNGTQLRDWIVQQVVVAAVQHPAVDGLFLDDYWCSNVECHATMNSTPGCPCTDPVQGPTEVDRYSQVDTGLTDDDIYHLTLEWRQTMAHVEEALLQHGAYAWSMMHGQQIANAWPEFLTAPRCAAALRDACQPDSYWQVATVLFGFTVQQSSPQPRSNGTAPSPTPPIPIPLPQLPQDLAFFLLARGPYAYAGWGAWGMTWPFGDATDDDDDGGGSAWPPDIHGGGVPLPPEFDVDYGRPVGDEAGTGRAALCREVSAGVFQRNYTRAYVELDCNTFAAKITTVDAADDDATNAAAKDDDSADADLVSPS